MTISATYNQQLTDEIHVVMICKLLILRSAKSISDRLLEKQFATISLATRRGLNRSVSVHYSGSSDPLHDQLQCTRRNVSNRLA